MIRETIDAKENISPPIGLAAEDQVQLSSGAAQGSLFPAGNVGERLLAVPGGPGWPVHVAC